jgi:hypothetical protein
MSKIPRWPDGGTRFNNADNVERYLQEDGHRTWGLVIYRCTYARDDDWNKFMELLRQHIQRALKCYNGLDLMESLSLTVIEDPSTLDDASTSFVREHFKQWVTTAPEREQGEGVRPGLSQRYRYCIQVDDAALESIMEDEDEGDGFVNLIKLEWVPETPHPREPVEDPIEDCTLFDVGWIMVAWKEVMVDMYHLLRDYDDWCREYRRPPEVAHA